MTSKARELYQHYAGLLKSDPLAKIGRESSSHEARLTLITAGWVLEFRRPGDVGFGGKALNVLTEAQIRTHNGDVVAYGASGSEDDALEQALFGYCRERVAEKLA